MYAQRFPDSQITFGALFARRPVFSLHFSGGRREMGIQVLGENTLGVVLLALQNRLDDPMREQIRIATYRACEMRIGVIRQAEVPDIVGTVNRLLHGTQQHSLQEQCVRAAFDFFHQCCVIRRSRRCATAQTETELLEECPELIQFFFGGAGVDTIHSVMLVALHEIGSADIRGQHAFFD